MSIGETNDRRTPDNKSIFKFGRIKGPIAYTPDPI